MPSWVVPSDSHVVSDTGHTTDHNHVADDLTLINSALPVVSGGLTGAVQAARFAGATTSGAPASGTFAVGDFIVDQSGTIWLCTTAGSPGTWVALLNATAAQTVTGVKVFQYPGNTAYAASGNLVVSTDGTVTSGGAIVLNPNSETRGFIAIYSTTLGSAAYFVPDIATSHWAPSVGGATGTGIGVVGSTSATGAIVFGCLNFSQTGGYGAGNAAFTVYDNNKVQSFNSTLDDGSGNAVLGGGLTTKVRTATTSGAVSATDSVVLLNAATLTATLPTAVGITGRQYTVKLITASTGTVATTSSQTIDGSTTYSLSANHKYVTVVSDGANWQIVANN